MTKEEFNTWLKEHNGKCSLKELVELGFTYHLHSPHGYWADEKNEFALIVDGFIDKPYQPPKIEEVIQQMETYLDKQYYSGTDHDFVFSNKKWYDKFYEHKSKRHRRWK